ncbi:hypothetical protein B0H13DRAFT_2359284 [Mycena leptocephala]|nr:hypothetical protein B0H13DRAFT_2359284 [Mycena leptocephala]
MPAPGQQRCKPRYFPSLGDEDTFDVDGDVDGRFFVVSEGRGTGIFTDVEDANAQTDGFSGWVKRSAKKWTGAIGIWEDHCDKHHTCGCPPVRMPVGFTHETPVNRVSHCPASSSSSSATSASVSSLASASVSSLTSTSSTLTSLPPYPSSGAPPPAPASTAAPRSTPQSPSTPSRGGDSWQTGGPWDGWNSPNVVRSSVSPSPLGSPYAPASPSASSTTPRPPITANTRIQLTSKRGEYEAHLATQRAKSSSSSSSSKPVSKRVENDEVQQVFWAVEGVRDRIFTHHSEATAAMSLSTVTRPTLMHSTDIVRLEKFASGRLGASE